MEIARYSYTWGSITRPREVDYPKLFQWYRDRDISSIELYDPWIEDKDHVHFKDWITYDEEQPGESWLGHGNKWYQGCRFGEGIVPQKAAADRLKELGYDGLVSPEYEGPGDPYEYMDQATKYSRTLIA